MIETLLMLTSIKILVNINNKLGLDDYDAF